MKKTILAILAMAVIMVGCAEEAKAGGYGYRPTPTPVVNNYENAYNDEGIRAGIATAGAIALLSDDLGIGDTNVSASVAAYDDIDVMAVGVTHRFQERLVGRLAVSQSLDVMHNTEGDHALFGGSIGYRW